MGGYQNPNEKEIDLPFPLIALTISHIVQKHQSGRESCYLNVPSQAHQLTSKS